MHHDTDLGALQARCTQTDSFAELVPIALAELEKFVGGCNIVCGPISTGGRGSVEENLKVFFGTIDALRSEGREVFSQKPYEERIFFFRTRWQGEDPSRSGAYCMPILEEFYEPLFKRGIIKDAWFIPGWESSFGARWERKTLTALGVTIHDLTTDWVDQHIPKS